jgi:hypothetical protein
VYDTDDKPTGLRPRDGTLPIRRLFAQTLSGFCVLVESMEKADIIIRYCMS